MTPVVFISAGEASGEHYGALLATELRKQVQATGQSLAIWGMGGPQMEAAGVERVVRSEDVAVMGFTEVVLHLPRIYREFRKLKRAIRARRPDVAVLIDFPEIHFRLAKEFKRLGVPVIYFVSPQIWAWKQHRIKLVREFVRRMLVIFPFEEGFYRERGVEAEYVGHPLAELPLPAVSREEYAARNGLDVGKTWIGILPGSRMREIEANLPEMLEAARGVKDVSQGLKPQSNCGVDGTAKAVPFQNSGVDRAPYGPEGVFREAESVNSEGHGFEFVIPLASTLDARQREAVVRMVERCGGGLAARLVDDARAALFHARASVVASGTATVEAALMGNPFVVVYRVSPLTYAIARRVVKVPHVAMANLIAGKRVVPELIQKDFTAANIVQRIKPLLPDGPVRESMRLELEVIRSTLRAQRAGKRGQATGAIERVARIVLQTVESGRPAAVEASQR